MATELTWTGDVNRAVASAASTAEQNKWELWYLLASLCGNSNLAFSGSGGKWSVVRTCGSTDGTAGNLTADATDRLHLSSGVYTSNDWVFGANTTSGTGRSWALIQSPSAISSYYLIVDFGNSTGGKCDIIFGRTISTNGTTTARPTLTDEWSYSGAQYNNNSIANTHRVNMHLSSRGDFWFYETFDTNGVIYSVLGLSKLSNIHAADSYPGLSVFASTASSVLTISLGSSTSLCGSSQTTVKGRNFNGANAATWFCIAPAFSNAGTASTVISGASNLNAANASDSTYNGFPVWIGSTTEPELKGRIPDMLFISNNPAQNTTFPNTTPFDYIKIGGVALPWVSTSAPLS